MIQGEKAGVRLCRTAPFIYSLCRNKNIRPKEYLFLGRDIVLVKINRQQNKNGLIGSWSVGKDSCLACYKVLQMGCRISFLLNLISKKYQRCCFHGIQKELIDLQSDLIGIPLFQKEVSEDMRLYEKEFKEVVLKDKKCQTQGTVLWCGQA